MCELEGMPGAADVQKVMCRQNATHCTDALVKLEHAKETRAIRPFDSVKKESAILMPTVVLPACLVRDSCPRPLTADWPAMRMGQRWAWRLLGLPSLHSIPPVEEGPHDHECWSLLHLWLHTCRRHHS